MKTTLLEWGLRGFIVLVFAVVIGNLVYTLSGYMLHQENVTFEVTDKTFRVSTDTDCPTPTSTNYQAGCTTTTTYSYYIIVMAETLSANEGIYSAVQVGCTYSFYTVGWPGSRYIQRILEDSCSKR